jgi:hypothetical protein
MKNKIKLFLIHLINKPVADYAQKGEENKGNVLAEPLKVACKGVRGISVEYCLQNRR